MTVVPLRPKYTNSVLLGRSKPVYSFELVDGRAIVKCSRKLTLAERAMLSYINSQKILGSIWSTFK